mmetsp:Transcript_102983/g.322004  ORF Transcript_102983/g.322004 Transcript_102983/m.322004 type:complete len:358 (+) Transcript_102983:153-1226(+)
MALLRLSLTQLPLPLPESWKGAWAEAVEAWMPPAETKEAVEAMSAGARSIVYRMAVTGPILAVISIVAAGVQVSVLLLRAVQGFKREYVLLVRGGSKAKQWPPQSPWKATLFPGILISMTFLAYWCAVIVVFAVGLAITLLAFHVMDNWFSQVLARVGWAILPVAVAVLIKAYLIQKLLFEKWLCTAGGYIKHPVLFSLCYSVFSVINIIYGLWYSIMRLVSIWTSATKAVVFRVDRHGGPEHQDPGMDPVYSSLLAVAQLTERRYNPIFRIAVLALCPDVAELSQDVRQVAGEAVDNCVIEARARRLRVRNRFWLWVTLVRNPNLAEFRWRPQALETPRVGNARTRWWRGQQEEEA